MVTTAGSIEKFRSEDEDYEVVSLIGAGGMGTVYKARQKSLARFVAIKALNPESCGDTESIARLKREAAAAAQVSHPNVVKVHSIGLQAGTNQPFIVMELVEGESLDAILRARPMAEAEAVELVGHVLDGLTALHGAGLVHRDIKPSNIVVTADGGVKLMDLGIVKALDRFTQKLTQTGATIGSPAYMSPEQCSGSSTIDGRADIYSVACTLYRALSGKAPFEADAALEVMLKHLHDPAPRLDGIASPQVAAAVAKAMEKDPADRFATTDEFKQALLGKVEVVAPVRKARVSAEKRQTRLAAFIAAAVIVGGIACGAYAISTRHSAGDEYAAKFAAELQQVPTGRLPHEALQRAVNRVSADPRFATLSANDKKQALRPAVEYAQKEIAQLRTKPPEDRLFLLLVSYGYVVAAYDEAAGDKIIQDAIAENLRLDLAHTNNRDVWNRLSLTYCAALASYRTRHMDKQFDETFAKFESILREAGGKDFQLKDAAEAYLLAADRFAYHSDYATAEAMARKALAMRQEAELTGSIEQVAAYVKICEELRMQSKWKELVTEAEKALPASGLVMDKADDKYRVRKERAKLALYAAEAWDKLGDPDSAEQYRRLAADQSQLTSLQTKQ